MARICVRAVAAAMIVLPVPSNATKTEKGNISMAICSCPDVRDYWIDGRNKQWYNTYV